MAGPGRVERAAGLVELGAGEHPLRDQRVDALEVRRADSSSAAAARAACSAAGRRRAAQLREARGGRGGAGLRLHDRGLGLGEARARLGGERARLLVAQAHERLAPEHAVALAHGDLGHGPGDEAADLDPRQRRDAPGGDDRLHELGALERGTAATRRPEQRRPDDGCRGQQGAPRRASAAHPGAAPRAPFPSPRYAGTRPPLSMSARTGARP